MISMIAECSFSSGTEEATPAGGHLTPALLEIAEDLAGLDRPVEMFHQGRTYTFS